jgi:hypothetical protein
MFCPSSFLLLRKVSSKKKKRTKSDPVQFLWNTFIEARKKLSDQERGMKELNLVLEKKEIQLGRNDIDHFEDEFFQKQCNDIIKKIK